MQRCPIQRVRHSAWSRFSRSDSIDEERDSPPSTRRSGPASGRRQARWEKLLLLHPTGSRCRCFGESGEGLLDLRKTGPFKGRGALLAAAKTRLQAAWEKGSSADVAEAMARFREAHERDLVEHAPSSAATLRRCGREWAGRISSWLYGTDHITVSYGVQYEGVDIEQLSPRALAGNIILLSTSRSIVTMTGR